ncbi:MAG: sugar phosphate isomerase/epimerase, partial [Planctomycetes bacterium]|nr:sugar phosphate isomerase/epimerase [Planctomycetota bacterium]
MMKTCGHTMGTPKMDIFQAIEFFASIGHQGIEVRCAADGQLNPEAYDSGWGKRAVDKARAAGIEIACLTPYYRDFVNPAKRASELAAMRRVVDIAVELNCQRVRSYGGITPS